ncbi:LADA_0B09428g1_1 [Lachancea dasiensis]|uniref:LADA_0B09428g1_1 n=1 Tax=Lachancea dasiensis TaxID=1072105 RepID=A0A1G4IUQ4_9SACH|nr:LADA_0B09428g1_1 [Lachancea dasiensis]
MKLFKLLWIALTPVLVSCHVHRVTSLDLFYDTVNNDAFTVVKYYTTWCSHCKKLGPVFDTLSESFRESNANVTFLEVNCEIFASTLCRRLPGYPMVEVIKPLRKVKGNTTIEQSPASQPSWWSRLVTKIRMGGYDPAWTLDLDRVVEFNGSRDLPILANFIDKVIDSTQKDAEVENILYGGDSDSDQYVSIRRYLTEVKDIGKEIRKLENILKYNADEELESIRLKLRLLRVLAVEGTEMDKNGLNHDEL